MSVFENIFKLKKSNENEEKINLLMEVTNGKMTSKETKRVFDILNQEIMQKVPEKAKISEAMSRLEEIKGDWLTREEKENFVAGVWMLETMNDNKKDKKYINSEQLKYVRQAVLGTEFKGINQNKYYSEFKEYKEKY